MHHFEAYSTTNLDTDLGLDHLTPSGLAIYSAQVAKSGDFAGKILSPMITMLD